ncbi:MAG: glycosyltransferase [Planctomycetota bacterium]
MSADSSLDNSPHLPADASTLACITVTHNSAAVVDAFLDGIAELEAARQTTVETWIIDNASEDDTLSRLEAGIAARGLEHVHVIASPDNRGWCAGNNLGLRAAGSRDWVLYLNPDVRLSADGLDRLIEAITSHPNAGAAVPLLLQPGGERRPGALPTYSLADGFLGLLGWRRIKLGRLHGRHRDRSTTTLERAYPEGGCLLVDGAAQAAIGELDERFFLYFDDTDLGLRLARAGFDTLVVGDVDAEQMPTKGSVAKRGGDPAQERKERAAAYSASELEFYRKWYGGVSRLLAIYKLTFELPLRALAWRILYRVPGLFTRCAPILWRHLAPASETGRAFSGSVAAIAAKGIGAGFAFLFNLLLAVSLGTDGAGVYFIALTVTTLAATLGRRGLSNAMVRFTAEHASRESWTAVRTIFRQSLGRSSLVSVTVAASIALLAEPLAQLFDEPELVTPLRWMAAAIVPLALSRLEAEALRGLGHIALSQALLFIVIPGVASVSLFFIGDRWSVDGAAVSFALGTWTATLIGLLLWLMKTRRLPRGTEELDGQWRSGTMPLLWVELLTLLLPAIPTWLLAKAISSDAVGVYGVAQTMAGLIAFIAIGFNAALAPRFAAMFAEQRIRDLESLAVRATRWMTVLAAIPFLLFVLFAGSVMTLFGTDFRVGRMALVILAAGQLVNVASGPVGCLLMMTGHERLMRNTLGLTVCVALVSNAVLIPAFGIEGAAGATALSWVTMNVLSWWLVRDRLGFSTVRAFSLRSR